MAVAATALEVRLLALLHLWSKIDWDRAAPSSVRPDDPDLIFYLHSLSV